MRFGGTHTSTPVAAAAALAALVTVALVMIALATPANAQTRKDMRFDCFSTRTDGGGEKMEHDVVVDPLSNAVSDNGVVFRNGTVSNSSTTFVTSAAGGARWGVTAADGTIIAEFRVATEALTYGFFTAGTLQAQGPCTRTR